MDAGELDVIFRYMKRVLPREQINDLIFEYAVRGAAQKTWWGRDDGAFMGPRRRDVVDVAVRECTRRVNEQRQFRDRRDAVDAVA